MRRLDWEALSSAELDEVLARHVAERERRSQRFVDDVSKRRRYRGRLDGSIDSIDVGWAWALKSWKPSPTSHDELLGAAEVPLWAHDATGVAARLGVEVANGVADLAAYTVGCLIRQYPDEHHWSYDRDRRDADYGRPRFGVGSHPGRFFDCSIGVAYTQWRDDLASAKAPDVVKQLALSVVGTLEPEAAADVGTADELVFGVDIHQGGGRWTHTVVFDDEFAWESEEIVAGLIPLLQNTDGVTEAVHEDREVFLLVSELSVEELTSVIQGLIEA